VPIAWIWIIAIVTGLTTVNVYWEQGGSLTALNFWVQIWIIVFFGLALFGLIVISLRLFIPVRNWFYVLLYKQKEKIKVQDELVKRDKIIKKQNAIIAQYKRDKKRLMGIVNDKDKTKELEEDLNNLLDDISPSPTPSSSL